MHYEKYADGTVKCIQEIVPFDLPDGWEWSRLGSISTTIQYGLSNSAESNGTHRLLRITDIQEGKVDWNRVPFTSVDEPENYLLAVNDIVFARTGATVGKSFLIKELPYEAVYASYLIRIRLANGLLPEYLYHFFNSRNYWDQITSKAVGVGQPNCNGTSLRELLVPIPPLNEQARIAPNASSLLAYIWAIEKNQNDITTLINHAKARILDLAIRGQLVPQNPEDESASALLVRIREEKEALIKAGKLKRDKRESVIFHGDDNSYYEKVGFDIHCIDDQIPFDIPDGWIWARGFSCFAGMENRRPSGEAFDYIDIDSIDNHAHAVTKPKRLSVADAPSRASRAVKSGCVLFSLVRPYLQNIAYIPEEFSQCIASTGFYVCISNGLLNPEYLYYLMLSPYVVEGLNQFMKGDNSPSISKDDIENWLYPIPPLEEQKRVEKEVNTLFETIMIIEAALQ